MTYAWRGTVRQLRTEIAQNRFLTEIATNFEAYFGRVTESELKSWQESIPALLECFNDPEFDDLLVILEQQMPIGADRSDVLLLGGPANSPKALIIELKQWSRVSVDPESGVVDVQPLGPQRHPSIQAANYAGKLHLFNQRAHDYDFSAAVFLHNATDVDISALIDNAPQEWTAQVPVYGSTGKNALSDYVRQTLLPSELTLSDAIRLSDAPYAQSKHLFAFIGNNARQIASDAELALAGTGMGLTDDQAQVKAEIIQTLMDGNSRDFIIQGGPGSGKTLLALSLLLRSLELGKSTLLAIRNNRLMAIVRAVLDRAYPGASGTTLYFETPYGNHGIAQKPINVDLIICDEAQRMAARNPSNVLHKARVTAIFLDETQRLNPPEQGTIANFEAASTQLGRIPVVHRLDSVVRCQGGEAYHGWVERLLDQPDNVDALSLPAQPWRRNYETQIHASMEDMLSVLASRRDDRTRVALVASFTESPGNSKNPNLPDNLRIGYPLDSGFDLYQGADLHLPWLMKPAEYQSFWYRGTSNKLDRVASIYGTQGFESDYVGVVWGRDLIYRSGRWQPGQPVHCYDSIDGLVRGRKDNRQWSPDALTLLKNRYRIFLTRGIKGTHIFCEDEETRQHLLRLDL